MDNRRSFRTAEFKEQVNRLPKKVQEDVQESFALWKDRSPVVCWQSLNCADGNVSSARINYRYRALATELTLPDGSVCWMWFWAGRREEYENVIKSSKLQNTQKQAVATYERKFALRAAQQRKATHVNAIDNGTASTKVSTPRSRQKQHSDQQTRPVT